MLVTGVQAVGAKSLTAVQATVVDPKDATRAAANGNHDGDRGAGAPAKVGDPQPIVFPRAGVGVDPRPSALRHQHAAKHYRADGGDSDHDDAA